MPDGREKVSWYRYIKQITHTMKFWERIIEQKVIHETRISKNQFDFT